MTRGAERAQRRARRGRRRTVMASRLCIYGLLSILAALAGPAAAQPTTSVWEAASNVGPEDVCPAWKLVDTAPTARPVLSDGQLVLATAAPEQDMFYMQTTALLQPLPDPIVVEATVRFMSGTSNRNNRGPI